MVDIIFEIHRQYWNLWIFVDRANHGFITSYKIAFNENIHYERAENVSVHSNKIIPVNFGTQHKNMISHLVSLFNDGYVAVPSNFEKLLIILRRAWVYEYSLDKEQSSYLVLLDALRLSLRCYNVT